MRDARLGHLSLFCPCFANIKTVMAKIKNRKTRHRVLKAAHPIRWRFRKWLVPNRRNNFRPRFIDRYGMAGLLLLFVAAQAVSPVMGGASVLGQQAPISTIEILRETNDERAKVQASPLKINDELSHAASLKAQDMLQYGYWSHTSPSGVTPWSWLDKVGYSYSYAGENLAKNFSSANAVVAAWMVSPGHKENMLHGYYTEVGFAVADGMMNGRPVHLVVALYATPASSLTAVAGMHTNAPTSAQLGLMSRIGVAVQSMSPAMIGWMVLLSISLMVALITSVVMFSNRENIRGGWWRKYHAGIKLIGMSVFVIMVVLAQSYGQIG